MEEGTPSRRKKELTEYDKPDAVTKWSKEMMDLRQDADKNSAEATAVMAKYKECADHPDEQGHAHPAITELDTFTVLRQEVTLLKKYDRQVVWLQAGF